MASLAFSFSFSFSLQHRSPTSTRLSASSSTVKLSSFFAQKNKHSLSLSSSRSVSAFPSSVSLSAFGSASTETKKPFSLFVVSAKGYKMKTHKASAKRFRVTGTGKIMRRRAGKQHLLRKKNTKRRVRLSKMVQVDRCDYNNVIGALPYLKVNRQN